MARWAIPGVVAAVGPAGRRVAVGGGQHVRRDCASTLARGHGRRLKMRIGRWLTALVLLVGVMVSVGAAQDRTRGARCILDQYHRYSFATPRVSTTARWPEFRLNLYFEGLPQNLWAELRTDGHRQTHSVRVCSPPSRRVAPLRPRCAGLTAWTPAPRTLVPALV